MTGRQLGALLLLGSIWGASFLFIRIAVPVLGPVVLVDIRVFVAGAALLLYAAVLRRRLRFGRDLLSWLILGAINAAIPFLLISISELHIPAALAAILNSTTPLFTAVVAARVLGEPFTRAKGVGLLLGLLGVVALVGLSPLHLSPIVLLSIGASLAAALVYATRASTPNSASRGLRFSSWLSASKLPRGWWCCRWFRSSPCVTPPR